MADTEATRPLNRRERRAQRARSRVNLRKVAAAASTVTRATESGRVIDAHGVDRLAERFGIERREAVAIAGSLIRHGVKR